MDVASGVRVVAAGTIAGIRAAVNTAVLTEGNQHRID